MMKFADSLFINRILSDQERNSSAILEIVRKMGPVSKSDIASKIDLNIVTTSNYISTLIKKGFLRESGLDTSRGGRRPVLIELNPDAGFSIGIDLGTMDIPEVDMVGVVLNLKGEVICRVAQKRLKETVERVLLRAADFIEEILKECKIDRSKLQGIMLGIGGVVDVHMGIVHDTSQNGKKVNYKPALDKISSALQVPVFLNNDATLAAFGEKIMGVSSEEVNNMLYIYADSGCGIIIKGELYCGISGSAGEIGIHIPNRAHAEFMHGPRYLKALGLDLGICDQARKLIQEKIETKILELAGGKPESITLEVIKRAAEKNDKLAIDLIKNAAVNLGIKIAYLVNIFNPEIVTIGGGIEQLGQLFLEPLRESVSQWAFEEPASKVKIAPSFLGKEAVAIGAACVVTHDTFINALHT